MFSSSDWKIIVVLSTLTIFQLPKCDGKLEAYGENGTVSAVFQTQGHRDHMEDKFIRIENSFGTGIGVYAVFDGHSGDRSSNFSREHFTNSISNELMLHSSNRCSYVRRNGKINFERMLKDFIAQADAHLENEIVNQKLHKSGTTCLIAIAEKSRLTVANVGDSRGVMCTISGDAFDLSFDHKPDREDEKERILSTGGRLHFKGVWRVDNLAMSRSLGDNHKKQNNNAIIATPEIRIFDSNTYQPRFIILASDGLWDVMSSQAAVDFIELRYSVQKDFGAMELASRALYSGSTDNITILIVVFKNGHYEVGSASV